MMHNITSYVYPNVSIQLFNELNMEEVQLEFERLRNRTEYGNSARDSRPHHRPA